MKWLQTFCFPLAAPQQPAGAVGGVRELYYLTPLFEFLFWYITTYFLFKFSGYRQIIKQPGASKRWHHLTVNPTWYISVRVAQLCSSNTLSGLDTPSTHCLSSLNGTDTSASSKTSSIKPRQTTVLSYLKPADVGWWRKVLRQKKIKKNTKVKYIHWKNVLKCCTLLFTTGWRPNKTRQHSRIYMDVAQVAFEKIHFGRSFKLSFSFCALICFTLSFLLPPHSHKYLDVI